MSDEANLFTITDDDGKKHCQCCGQAISKAYPHRMDRSKIEILTQIAQINRTYVWVKLQQDGRLISDVNRASTIQCDAVHGCRLYWFKLLDYRGPRSGQYRVNQRGIDFLRGKLKVPERIWCIGGHIERVAFEKVSIDQVKGVVLNKQYWDGYPTIH